MVKVVFVFDREKDLWNHWDKINNKTKFGNFKIHDRLVGICKGKSFFECHDELEKHWLLVYSSGLMKIQRMALEKAWRGIEKDFFKRMDKLMKNKFKDDITAYQITSHICPYNTDENFFMFSFFSSFPFGLMICGHEIMHLYFHKFYWDRVEKELGNKKTGILKEALSVLLNHDFKDLWFVDDMGYEEHKEIRDFISREWNKKKDFEILIDKCIQFMKEI